MTSKLEELNAAYAAAQATYDAEYAATYEELISARKAAEHAFNAARVAAVLTYNAAYAAKVAGIAELKKHRENTHGMATD